MQPAGFLCPECSAPLRLRDRSQLGRQIDCPDCGTRLQLQANGDGIRAIRSPLVGERFVPPRAGSRSVLRMIWLATAGLAGAIIWVALRPVDGEETVRLKPVHGVPLPVKQPSPLSEITSAAVPLAVDPPPPVPEQVQPVPEPPVPVVDPPLSPELAPDPPLVDIPAQLSLRIAEFSQTKPVPVRLLLRQVAELSAVAIDLSEVEIDPWKAKLDQAITLELKDTTVGAVLEEVLRQAGFERRFDDGVIKILPIPQ